MTDAQRIVYIDDNPDHLAIVKAMLKREGYTCETFSTAEKGIEVALSQHVDLILLDIQMPKISGIEVLNKLKARKEEIGFRIVAITADGTVFSKQNPYQLGFDGHLTKPILPPDLSRIVNQMLSAKTE